MIHYAPELPKEGSMVYAAFADSALKDRCVFKNGEFIAEGMRSPIKVEKWLYEKEYAEYFKKEGISSYFVSFENAERIGCMKDIVNILRVVTETENACVESGIYPGLTIRDNTIELENKLQDLKRKLEENINAS